ncbi:MAG: type I 3-dehydroquinate dehydratase [Eubacterium sp.]|nr:type I 3-dehydroquinate dehydratase [Eubacterium sp.]
MENISGERGFTIKGFEFGNGTPRIVVPVMGLTDEELFDHASKIRTEIDRLDSLYPDDPNLRVAVIEWRADYYIDILKPGKLVETLSRLRDIFSDRVLLFTFRTEEQGGYLRPDMAMMKLHDIMPVVGASGLVDMIDVEAAVGNYNMARAALECHENGLKVIISYHDFYRTPHDSEIIEKLRTMEILGADILKIAVMPKNEFDTRRVMELNTRMSAECFKPVVIIAMGETGILSRIKGKQTGSCLTFASIGQESAPGQIEAADLIALLKNQ